ncbi:MAG: bifunctional 4-hydroxy-2-oxoglutarate aldolase/2-dehydro-3-deoxy-phosphogluconate aldolase [Chloroflexota bacterium]|nr:bifunctional 4-hydroxy-2-oxoglutarate aldolase/2-dehydro-3-deoxy-phosphogluconate aldolase [Chloroflexota bacterium]
MDRRRIVEEDGVVAVVRLDDLSNAVAIAQALLEGGVRAVEFTFTNRRAAEAIGIVRDVVGDAGFIGAGTVLDPETARVAILAGAEYVVTPTFKAETVQLCNRYGIPTVIGALTPTEILTAWEAGANYVKVHPASLGGPKYFKDVLGPMPQVKLVPSGGVTFDNVAEFVRAGAVAVALGSNLVDAKTVGAGDWSTITERARTLRGLVRMARER